MKEKNIKKLDDWYASIGSPKLIEIAEAKQIYLEMVKSTSKVEQKKLFEELVLGTIPVVYENIKNSYLPYIAYNEYDIDDILYAGIEIWVDWLRQGELLKWSYYSIVFKKHRFFWKLKQYFIPESFAVYNEYNMESKEFYKLFYRYLCDKESTLPMLQVPVIRLFEAMNYILKYEIHLFEQETKIPKRQIIIICPFLLQKTLNRPYNQNPNFLNTLVEKDQLSTIENKLIKEDLIAIINSLKLTEKQKNIMHEYYDNNITLKKIGISYNCTRENIRQLNQKVLEKIRCKGKIKLTDLNYYLDITPEDYPFLSLKKR